MVGFWYYAATMSNAQEYAYTFQMIIPYKTDEVTLRVRDELLRWSDDSNVPLIASNYHEHMSITVQETVEYPDQRLMVAMLVAKSALAECSINGSVFTRAYATLQLGRTLLSIHCQVVLEHEDDTRIDLTDTMYHEELGK